MGRRLRKPHADASTSDGEDRERREMVRYRAQIDVVVAVAGIAIGAIAGFVMGRRAARVDDAPARGDGVDDDAPVVGVVVDDSDSAFIDRLRTALMDAQTMAQDADRRREYAERALASARTSVAADAGPSRVAESAPVTPQKKRSRPNDAEHVELPSPWAHKPRLVMNEPASLVAFAKAGRSVSRYRSISRRRPAFADARTDDDDDDDDDDDVPITRRQYSQSVPQSPSKTPLEQ